jgi:hypothetical protein
MVVRQMVKRQGSMLLPTQEGQTERWGAGWGNSHLELMEDKQELRWK